MYSVPMPRKQQTVAANPKKTAHDLFVRLD